MGEASHLAVVASCASAEDERPAKAHAGIGRSRMSPTQLTLRKLREDGYMAKVVERWNMFARIRQDLWGFDVIGCKRGEIVLVQATSASNLSSRVKKVAELDTTPALRDAGFTLLCWGWKKVKNRWTCVERDVS